MEINDANIQQFVVTLQQTLSPDAAIRKNAEERLKSFEFQPNYAMVMLNLLNLQSIDMYIRVTAAVCFKNFIKRYWPTDSTSVDGVIAVDRISHVDRNNVKSTIIGLMLSAEPKIQKQLSEAVSIIGREDFPDKWPELLNEMVKRIGECGGDFNVINGVLQTAHSIFRRYRHEFKSDELFVEMKFVLENFAKPFTELFVATCELARTHANNPKALEIIFSSLVLCAKIFYSLNSQDLPEFFEDNMGIWMTNFLQLLSANHGCLETDAEEAGLLQQLKSQICDIIAMYAQKYNDEFEPYLSGFVSSVWSLLTSLSNETKYDLLVSNAIRFISTVAYRPQYSNLFDQPGVLDSLCSKVVIPNMEFRQSDEDMFFENPEEFIRRDIEGSDMETRRRAACDLVKSLSRFFDQKITQIFTDYINQMLQEYSRQPENFWKHKDTAIYLVTTLSVKRSTLRDGTVQVSDLVNITDFYYSQVKVHLDFGGKQQHSVLIADALKYLITLRNQLSFNDIILPAIPNVIEHLNNPSMVIHTYAAHAIERIMTMREQVMNVPKLQYQMISPHIGKLIQSMFHVFTFPGSAENEYVMKAIMRTLSLCQEEILPLYDQILPRLASKLSEISKSPSKPFFNHHLFESLALCMKFAIRKSTDSIGLLESLLFPIFEDIMARDVPEFVPYVFQLVSLLLEARPSGENVPELYMNLFPHLVSPVLWDVPANARPLARLLQATVDKLGPKILALNKLEALLGVFQKLIASKANDHEGFKLLDVMLEKLGLNPLLPYLKQAFTILFQRLTNSKTTKFVHSIIVFFSMFAHRFGPMTLVELINGIQDNLFSMVLERLFIAESRKVDGNLERKITAIGISDILFKDPKLWDTPYFGMWPVLLSTLIATLELPAEEDTEDYEDHFVETEQTDGYQASYVQLVYAKKTETDPFGGTINNARQYLVSLIIAFSSNDSAKLRTLIDNVDPNTSLFLQKYMNGV